MSKKYFVLNEGKSVLSKKEINSIENGHSDILIKGYSRNRELTKKRILNEQLPLKHVFGRIIIKIDLDYKNTHTFESGVTIYRGRQFNDLNRRITEPVNAIVVDAEYIPKGVEILVHPNSIHDSNRIFNYGSTSIEQGNSVRYYSIEETSAFLFREGDTWKPLKGFATGLRVFEPYKGSLVEIAPTQLKNILYITSGEFTGKCVCTLRAADYEIIFQDVNGREGRIIRVRHFEEDCRLWDVNIKKYKISIVCGNPKNREEIIYVDHPLTNNVNKGQLLIGLSASDCKKHL